MPHLITNRVRSLDGPGFNLIKLGYDSLVSQSQFILLPQVSISSTLYECIFGTNVVSAAFSSYMYVPCTWKKLPKRRSYEKFVRKNVDEIDGSWLK